jgi:hypothetical protein
MLNQTSMSRKAPFIPAKLRANVWSFLQAYPLLEPDASKEQIYRLACEVLGLAGIRRLGLTDILLSPAMEQKVFARSPNVISTESDGETVLLHLQTGTYHTFNEAGTFIWERLADARPVADIIPPVCEHFDVTEGVARVDLVSFFTMLHQEQLVIEATDEQVGAALKKGDGPQLVTGEMAEKQSYSAPLVWTNGSLLELTAKSDKKAEKEGKDGEKILL